MVPSSIELSPERNDIGIVANVLLSIEVSVIIKVAKFNVLVVDCILKWPLMPDVEPSIVKNRLYVYFKSIAFLLIYNWLAEDKIVLLNRKAPVPGFAAAVLEL